ncbi:MAG: class I SAM-dependent methyltransferase [Acidimicrobiia bacterium]|nr:class I SAM-dependent methyltransferase [Acidimicrobiia bacterium]
MSYSIDPEGIETRALNGMVDFSGADVLEVGCGDGRMTWRYAEPTSSVLAVDTNPNKIRLAIQSTPASLASKVEFRVADVTELELSPESFDVAVLAHSL